MSLWFSLALCWSVLLGTVIELQQPELWPSTAYVSVGLVAMGLMLVLAAMARLRRLSARSACAMCVMLAVLAFAQTGWRASNRLAQRIPAPLEGQNLLVWGEVVGLPQTLPEGVRFRFRVDKLTDETGRTPWPHPNTFYVGLGWYAAMPPAVHAAQRWRFPVRLKAPHGHVNPHGFDYELWLWEQDLAATGYVRTSRASDEPIRLEDGPWWSVSVWRESVRASVKQTVDEPSLAGVLSALLVGDQSSIEQANWDVFRATGVAHLMAISGLHITGMAWLAGLIGGMLWRRVRWSCKGRVPALWLATPHVTRITGMSVALGYAVFSGWAVPAQRTVWMLWIVHGLAMRGLRWPWPLTWSVVAAAVVVMDPWAMLQAGFALSFVAVGLLFAAGRPDESRANGSDQGPISFYQRVRESVRSLVREQVLMTVCLAPLSLLLFQQMSLVGLLANLIAVPWVTLVVTPLCVLGLVWSKCWWIAAGAVQWLMPLLQQLSALSWAQWQVAAPPWWIGGFALLGGVALAMPWPWWWRLGGLCWCAPLLSWHAPRPEVGRFELWAADMGQGHAVLLRTHGHALLYDTGPRYSRETDAGQRVIVPLLRALDEHLDRVVLSHQDIDHSGGLRAVMTMQPQSDVLTSVALTHPMLNGLHAQRCVRGQRWNWDGVQFEILHPSKTATSADKPNAMSCVLRIQDAHGVHALLVGDIEAEQEHALLSMREKLAADWLLVPHHGSNTSSTSAFLQAVSPHWAVVQAGYRNRYGHPRPEVMARYADANIAVVKTESCGAAIWHSAKPQEMHCERELHPHYWHHKVP